MCDLCGSDAPEARERLRSIARVLVTLANHHESMADGDIVPHSDSSVAMRRMVGEVIGLLAKEWL